MSNIYANSFIDSPELNSNNMLQCFEDYAKQLEEMAKNYRNIVKFIKTKNIKILEAQGYSHGGFFRVDEIDKNRLKQAGYVIDFSEEEENTTHRPVFYIDNEFDDAIEEAMEELSNESCPVHINDMDDSDGPADHLSNILEPEFEPEFEIELDEEPEPFGEHSNCISLKEIIGSFDEEDEPIKIGHIGIDVQQIDDTKFNFNLTIADLNKNPVLVQFDRENCVFKYQCGSCDTWHYESLESIYRSLKTANALLSNLMVMSKESKELLAAIDFIDHDLRLLQALLRFDYALEDKDMEIDDEL